MAGEAPDYGSMIGDILGNPEAMEGVMQVAKAMGLGSAFGASGETGSNDSNDRNAQSVSSGSDSAVTGSSLASNGAINASDARSASTDNIPGIGGLPAVLASAGGIARAGGNSSGGIPAGGLSALLGDKQSSADRERLLIALRPYLSDSRSSMLDTVLRLMRLARLGDIGKLIGKL